MRIVLAIFLGLTFATSCSDSAEIIDSAASAKKKPQSGVEGDSSVIGNGDATLEKNAKTGVGAGGDETLNGTKTNPADPSTNPTSDPVAATPSPTPMPSVSPSATPSASPTPVASASPEPNRCTRFLNANNNLDVSGDGFISPIDSLIIVNYLNHNGPQVIPPAATGTIPNAPNPAPNAVLSGPLYLAPSTSMAYMDVNGYCKIDTLDSDAVMARLNAGP